VGVESYVGGEGWSSKKSDDNVGTNGKNVVLGPGLDGHASPDVSKDDAAEVEEAHNRRG